jgi:chitinase
MITVACPAGPSHYSIMHLKDMDQYVDVWNLMTYDYSGSWDSNAGHDANLYTNSGNPTATPFNTQQAVSDYVAAGVPTYKIVLGMPLYGRSFEQTTGIGATYNGIGSGSWENGVWDYKVLPKAGAQMMWDDVAQASYSYDPSTQELISFDTPAETKLKGQYIQAHGLGGAMFWEASGDRNDSGSLISTMNQVFGRLETNQNWLSYLGSQYDNMVSGMPGE